jgi:hypothetical protein
VPSVELQFLSLNKLWVGNVVENSLSETLEDMVARDFEGRSNEDKADFLKHTWCNHCSEADLGMDQPVEYEYKGIVTIEGRCLVCRQPVYTELTDDSF